MGVVKETIKTLVSPKRLALIGIGYSVYKQYKDSGKSAYEFFGKPTIDKLKEVVDRTDEIGTRLNSSHPSRSRMPSSA